MNSSQWAYPHEKFYVARRALLLPHPEGEERSIVIAFGECTHGLRGVRREDLTDAAAQRWYDTIQGAMKTDGLEDESGRGLWYVKAEAMTTDERETFANAVDELSAWFSRRFWGGE